MEWPEVYQQIEAITDRETALKLAKFFGGTQVYFPRLDKLLERKERDARIRQDYLKGKAISDIARCYGLSERRVRDILLLYKSS
ncbi:Mor transcription activator family protein [Desulfovulcanus sp.]